MDGRTALGAAIEAARDDILALSTKLTAYDAPSGVRYLGDQVVQQVPHLAHLLETRDGIGHVGWSPNAQLRRHA